LNTVSDTGFVKHDLFDNTWGDAIVNPRIYTDSWFSVVTETIYDYPHTFRTEKIWKPIIMAHPFVVAANRGYLKDLRNAGFGTFGHIIDESYDDIADPAARLDAVVNTIRDIGTQGAAGFWEASRDVCKHNQALLVEYNRAERAKLPESLRVYLDSLLR
jgi:hypothetical protein